MSIKRVSVVVTTYNRDDFLLEALSSLASQTTPLQEVVVVDDGGLGSARQIVEEFGANFRYVWQSNAGQQCARNLGVRESTGEWIAFLDDDDLWEPTRNDFISELIANDHVNLISGDFRKFTARGGLLESVFEEFDRHAPEFWQGIDRPAGKNSSVVGKFPTDRLFPVYPFWPSTLVIRRELFTRIGGWDVSLRGVKSEDGDFIFRAIKAGMLGIIWAPSVRDRCHPGNDAGDEFQVALGRIKIWEHLLSRNDLEEIERVAISSAITRGISEIHWSAFAKRNYLMVTELAKRIGWKNLSFSQRVRTVVAKMLGWNGQSI